MNYTKNRRSDITGLTMEKQNDYYNHLVDSFGLDWLKRSTPKDLHQLQILWNRQDILSSYELLSFAHSSLLAQKKDKCWHNDQIKKIKGKDLNNRKGAFFEINCVGNLAENCNVKPTSKNFPGIDFILESYDNHINVSLKNFGISDHEKKFNTDMKKIEDCFVTLLKKYSVVSPLRLVLFFEEYPVKPDYTSQINAKIENLILKILNKLYPFVSDTVDNLCEIYVGHLIIPNYSALYNSYHFLAHSPNHKNEFVNIESKILKSCDNLIANKNIQNMDSLNGIALHLHENVNLGKCQQYIESLLTEDRFDIINFIILYQVVVTRSNSSSNLTHIMIPPIINDKKSRNSRHLNEIKFSPLIGSVSDSPSIRQLHGGIPCHLDISKSQGFEINGYFYQSGHEYIKSQHNFNEQVGNLSNPAAGIQQHSVFDLNGEMLLISGKFPPTDNLLIL